MNDGGVCYWQTYGQAEEYFSSQVSDTTRSNKMAFTAKAGGSGGTFELAPEGMHVARCYQLIDLGTQEKTFQGKTTGFMRKIRVSWELLGEDRMSDGRPFMVSKSYFVTLHEKSALRKDLESWRGKPFTPEEEAGFDIAKLLGAYCMLNVVHSESNGKTYANIAAITPLMKGLSKPAAANELLVFDLESPDPQIYESLPDWLKEIIRESPEWKNYHETGGAAPAMVDFDDDVPF